MARPMPVPPVPSHPPVIWLFKEAKGEADPYLMACAQRHWTASCFPVLACQCVHRAELLGLLSTPERFSAMVCTSQRALDAIEAVRPTPLSNTSTDGSNKSPHRGLVPDRDATTAAAPGAATAAGEHLSPSAWVAWQQRPVFVVGPASAAKANQLGLTVDPSCQVTVFLLVWLFGCPCCCRSCGLV